MGEEDPKKAETEAGPSSVAKLPEDHHDPVTEEKEPVPNGTTAQDQQKFLNPLARPEVANSDVQKNSEDSVDRDTGLAQVEIEKRLALIKAWEENEKAKTDNKAYKRLSDVESWENSKKAVVEAKLRKFEEKQEKKKAEYEERMKNKISELHREAEEKRAMVEAKRGEDFLNIEETAAKFRAAGFMPRKFLACFS